MARKLKDFSFNGAGRPKLYDWEKYEVGTAYSLERGKDFPEKMTLASFRQTAYAFAKPRGLHCKTQLMGDDVLIVQFTKATDE